MIPRLGRSAGERLGYPLHYSWASLLAQLVKNPPGMWETWVRSLGEEDPLEKGMVIHSSILAWRILWTQGAWSATVHRVTKISYNFQASLVAQMVNNLPAMQETQI